MEICKSIKPTFECSISIPVNGGNTQSFSQKSRNDDTEKIIAFEFDKKETEIVSEWIEELKKSFNYSIQNPGKIIIKANVVNKVFENFKSYFNSISILLHNKIYQKILKAFTLALETNQPIEIQTFFSPDFNYCITVPLNKNGFDQLEHCHENKSCQKEWYIHESQVQALLEKFLFKVAADYHIPYMDTYESPVLPAENVSSILNDLKSIDVLANTEKEAVSFLKSALELAVEKNMPVYLFF